MTDDRHDIEATTIEIDRYVWLALGGIVAFGVLCGLVGWLAGLWTAQVWWAG